MTVQTMEGESCLCNHFVAVVVLITAILLSFLSISQMDSLKMELIELVKFTSYTLTKCHCKGSNGQQQSLIATL